MDEDKKQKQYAGTVPDGHRPLTINIFFDLHERLKVGAALMNSSMGEVLAVLVDEYMPVVTDGIPVWPEKNRKQLVKALETWREVGGPSMAERLRDQ